MASLPNDYGYKNELIRISTILSEEIKLDHLFFESILRGINIKINHGIVTNIHMERGGEWKMRRAYHSAINHRASIGT